MLECTITQVHQCTWQSAHALFYVCLIYHKTSVWAYFWVGWGVGNRGECEMGELVWRRTVGGDSVVVLYGIGML